MVRGDHPQRTPVYGAALIVAAMLLGTAVTYWSHPVGPVRVAVLVVAFFIAAAGFLMTLRDYDPRR